MNMQLKDATNLKQFHTVVKRAYSEAKEAGSIPSAFVCVFDKLVSYPAVVRGPGFRPVEVHREWRKRVARIYFRRRALRDGWFNWDIDWSSIYNWILENVVPILKLLMMALPFLI